MPVPHFNIKITQRSKGNSAVAGAAYQAGEKLFSEYDQKTKNYTCKKEVVYTEIMLPPNGELACLCNYSIAAFNNGGVGGQKRSALISRIIERYLFIAKRCKVMIQKWILCPVCGSKTRVRIREDTVLENFPLYCPKCKHETLISARQLNISVIKEPDAQTQSR